MVPMIAANDSHRAMPQGVSQKGCRILMCSMWMSSDEGSPGGAVRSMRS